MKTWVGNFTVKRYQLDDLICILLENNYTITIEKINEEIVEINLTKNESEEK